VTEQDNLTSDDVDDVIMNEENVTRNEENVKAHDGMNEQLQRLNGNIQLAYDGQSIDC
jgi:uncharacterized FlaG/YvyC family protein